MKRFTPQPSILYPLGDKRVSQLELYMALTDFDRRKEIAVATEPALVAAQEIRDALGLDGLTYPSTTN